MKRRSGGVQLGEVIQKNQRGSRRILYLCQPYLSDEAAHIGVFVTDAHSSNVKAGRSVERFLDDLVAAVLRLATGGGGLDNQATQAAATPELTALKDVMTLGSPGNKERWFTHLIKESGFFTGFCFSITSSSEINEDLIS